MIIRYYVLLLLCYHYLVNKDLRNEGCRSCQYEIYHSILVVNLVVNLVINWIIN